MNMKLNLESNNFSIETNRQERTEDSNTVSDVTMNQITYHVDHIGIDLNQ